MHSDAQDYFTYCAKLFISFGPD